MIIDNIEKSMNIFPNLRTNNKEGINRSNILKGWLKSCLAYAKQLYNLGDIKGDQNGLYADDNSDNEGNHHKSQKIKEDYKFTKQVKENLAALTKIQQASASFLKLYQLIEKDNKAAKKFITEAAFFFEKKNSNKIIKPGNHSEKLGEVLIKFSQDDNPKIHQFLTMYKILSNHFVNFVNSEPNPNNSIDNWYDDLNQFESYNFNYNLNKFHDLEKSADSEIKISQKIAKDLKIGDLVMINKNPCNITLIEINKEGKFSNFKLSITGVEIFTNEPYHLTTYSSVMVNVPEPKYLVEKVIDYDKSEGTVTCETANGKEVNLALDQKFIEPLEDIFSKKKSEVFLKVLEYRNNKKIIDIIDK